MPLFESVEKLKPHYPLVDIKAALCAVTVLRMTRTARNYAFEAGMTLQAVVDLVQGIDAAQFYKSMTSIADHTVWQDVYHVPFDELVLYVKFTVDPDGYLLISLKEK